MLTPEEIAQWGDRLPFVCKLVKDGHPVWVDRGSEGHTSRLAAGWSEDVDSAAAVFAEPVTVTLKVDTSEALAALAEVEAKFAEMAGEPAEGEQLPGAVEGPGRTPVPPVKRSGPGRPPGSKNKPRG